jgi:ketosteroid isomerase-like protein
LRWSKKYCPAQPKASQVSQAFAETLTDLHRGHTAGLDEDSNRYRLLHLPNRVQPSPIQAKIGNYSMRQIRLYSAALAACLPLFAFAIPATAGGSKRPPEAAIKAENARWAEAFGRGDYEAIGRLYTENGALLPPGGDRVTGGRAIAEYFTKGYAGSKPDTVSFSNYEFYGNEQIVTEVSDAEIHDHSGKLKFRGKQILIFVKQGGAWKVQRDIWNDYAPVKSDGR